MTKRLYFESAYLTEWQTRVSRTLQRGDGDYVVLEESAFYPHGGGQPNDEGTIQGIPVLDVISENDEVLHKVERLPDDTAVNCTVNWERRFDHMQQHSGQHLLSAVCRELYGAMTVSFHLGADYCTIDVERPELTPEQLAAIELAANRHIYLNHEIVSYFVTGEEAAKLPLVKRPKVTENIRVVEMKDVEYNGCGGTHVSSTGEIGMIKLLKAEKQKGNTRVYFKCGYRALAEFNENQRILGMLTGKLKTSREGLAERIEKWEQEQKQLQQELANVRAVNDEYLARELLSRREDGIVAHVFADKPLKDLQSLAAKLTADLDADALVLLATMAGNKAVMAHNGEAAVSCGAFFKEHLPAFNGKGGGSDKQAQAGFESWEETQAFVEFAKRTLAS
ncbi:DHHA1 domain-containing protein [Paenibacillus macerans]|uniref:alanyl-tRNA editing protein n=1 Tax=Paenibacillus macerans TaxID=44252 RepID=UPI0022E14BEB|nr:DHHA1 domain-containing protein [Paenibacillus macerans]MEC0137312.1 DHHA1 domain-containing protein [Paenibacillus macerans]